MNSRNEVSFWRLESEGIENEKRRNAVRINPFLGRPLEDPEPKIEGRREFNTERNEREKGASAWGLWSHKMLSS
jgi:hypothetical protein